jgi:hypothetical protein
VTLTGRVTSVHKLGDRWRAELLVGRDKVVVVGQPGAGIASGSLSEDRTATVTGIVRRPFPNATDRRFAVIPRFPADVRVAGRTTDTSATGSRETTGPEAGPGAGTGGPSQSAGSAVADPVDVDLVDLDAAIGRLVRVGGLVVELGPDGFTLDDGTAIGRVVLRAAALDQLTLVEPDDALNAIGRVEATADGPVVVVEDAGGISVAGDPVAAGSSVGPGPASGVGPSADPGAGLPGAGLPNRFAGLGGGSFGLDAGAAGVGTLLTISVASLAVTLLRREHSRRRMAARIAARLAVLAGPPARPPDANTAERGPSTFHSA